MEKSTRERVLDAALALLGERGAGAFSVRAVEDRAAAPHGTVRHHFGDAAGLRGALVERLLELELAHAADDPAALIRGWLGAHRARTRARYELMLMAQREPPLRDAFASGRDAVVAGAVAAGIPAPAAAGLVAAIDGLVLDALVRDADAVDPAALRALLGPFGLAPPTGRERPDRPPSRT